MKSRSGMCDPQRSSVFIFSIIASVVILAWPASLWSQATTTANPLTFGQWHDRDTWDTGVVPDSSSVNVVIAGDESIDTLVRIGGSEAYRINSLRIDEGDQLDITASGSSTLSPASLIIESRFGDELSGILANNSQLSLNSQSSLSSPRATLSLTGDTVISGNGSIDMIRGRISLDSGSGNKSVNEGNVIQGTGDIDTTRYSTIENGADGVIRAVSGELNINMSEFSSTFNNFGTLTAIEDGTLQINGGTLNNHGVIAPALGSKVVFNYMGLIGGRLSSADSGRIEIGGAVDPAGLSSNAFRDVAIDGDVHVTSEGQLRLFGTIENVGSLVVESKPRFNGSVARGVATVTPGAALTGAGEVVLAGGILRIYSDETDPLVVTSLGNVVRGNGNIEVFGSFVNEPGNRLVAESGTLELGPGDPTRSSQSTVVNRSQLIANDQGVLRLDTDSIDNTGGIILANDRGVVQCFTEITGGELKTVDRGRIVFSSGGVTDAKLDGDFEVASDSDFNLRGDIQSMGLIKAYGGIGIGGDVMLHGGGVIELLRSGSGIFADSYADSAILRNVDNTIRGVGEIGSLGLQVINEVEGVIEAWSADADESLSIFDLESPLLNRGTIRATQGSTLRFSHTLSSSRETAFVNNDGGVIEAVGDGSRVNLLGVSIDGGSLRTDALGDFYIPKETSYEIWSSVSNASLAGNFRFESEGILGLAGAIANTSQVQIITPRTSSELSPPYLPSRIVATQDVSLSGGGELRIDGDRLVISDRIESYRSQSSVGGDFTNVDGTISGNVSISFFEHQFINGADGVIAADRENDRLQIAASSENSQFINRGTLRASNGGTLSILGDFSNDGVIVAAADSLFGGTGTLINTVGGTLQGNGRIEFDTTINQGTIAPGASPGTLTIVGDLVLSDSSVLDFEALSAAEGMYDLLVIEGMATLGGTLSVDLSGFVGDMTDEIMLLSASQVTGAFDNVVIGDSLQSVDGRFEFMLHQDSSLPGSSRLFLTNISAVSVPEPSTLGLLGVAALFGLRRRRKSSMSVPDAGFRNLSPRSRG